MTERPPNQSESKKPKKEEIISFARELNERQESFLFSGIHPEDYLRMRAGILADEEASGYTAAMFDALITRFENEGMKVVLGKNPESGNVYILPAQSNDIENDGIFPRHLQITEGMNAELKKLISLSKS